MYQQVRARLNRDWIMELHMKWLLLYVAAVTGALYLFLTYSIVQGMSVFSFILMINQGSKISETTVTPCHVLNLRRFD